MKKLLASGAAFALLLALTSCASDTPTISGNPGGGETGSSASAAASTPSPTPTDNRMAAFGQTATFPDGVAIKVDFSGWVAATPAASGAVEGRIATFTVTVTNGSKKEWAGTLMGIPDVRVGPSLTPAEIAIDEGTDHFLTTVMPGESQSAKLGYGITAADSGQVRLEFMPVDFIGTSVIFQGELAAPTVIVVTG
ncbi:hypothetical protein ACS5PJ_10895 [Pseudarthrobacter sp. YS3]|uniref:hypothetical protein n=1 Tax=Pseudarthrobacter sp. YS3 TaxID=3453718 RepID=UPI003EE9E4D0